MFCLPPVAAALNRRRDRVLGKLLDVLQLQHSLLSLDADSVHLKQSIVDEVSNRFGIGFTSSS